MKLLMDYKLFCLLILFPILAYAQLPTWTIQPQESRITFTATQNNSPVSGEFTDFSGNIQGDLNQLEGATVTITVNTGSISTSYKELEDALKAAEWFDVNLFPKAVFQANNFKKINNNSYQALGKVTIRDKTFPLNVNFTLDNYTPTKAYVSGSTLLRRTNFGIGRGEWASTNEVKDEVSVNFKITVTKNR